MDCLATFCRWQVGRFSVTWAIFWWNRILSSWTRQKFSRGPRGLQWWNERSSKSILLTRALRSTTVRRFKVCRCIDVRCLDVRTMWMAELCRCEMCSVDVEMCWCQMHRCEMPASFCGCFSPQFWRTLCSVALQTIGDLLRVIPTNYHQLIFHLA